MIDYKNKKESGFTLIELLVVVAIIGLLASVVLVSLEESRQKARNSAKNQMVREYMNAIELYRSSNPVEGYPNLNGDGTNHGNGAISDTNEFFCLGQSSDTRCIAEAYHYVSDLNDEISDYIPGPPEDTLSLPYNSYDFKGIAYKCEENDPCGEYEIRWYLIGNDQECIKGVNGTNAFGFTSCTFRSEIEL